MKLNVTREKAVELSVFPETPQWKLTKELAQDYLTLMARIEELEYLMNLMD